MGGGLKQLISVTSPSTPATKSTKLLYCYNKLQSQHLFGVTVHQAVLTRPKKAPQSPRVFANNPHFPLDTLRMAVFILVVLVSNPAWSNTISSSKGSSSSL